jgi:hypothetical protein
MASTGSTRDHFLQADFPVLIRMMPNWINSEFPTSGLETLHPGLRRVGPQAASRRERQVEEAGGGAEFGQGAAAGSLILSFEHRPIRLKHV